MSYEPTTYLDARAYMRAMTGLPVNSLGIVGDDAHGTSGYHLGWDRVRLGAGLQDYSYRESAKDRALVDNAASAFDVGLFDVKVNNRRVTLLDLNHWALAQLRAHAPDSLWVREMIYTPDGVTVARWDRLGIRTTGDGSHRTHTHFSGFRDEENTPKRPFFERFFAETTGATMADSTLMTNAALRISNLARGTTPAPAFAGADIAGEDQWDVVQLKKLDTIATDAHTAATRELPGVTPDALKAAVVAALQDPAVLAAFGPAVTEAVEEVLGRTGLKVDTA